MSVNGKNPNSPPSEKERHQCHFHKSDPKQPSMKLGYELETIVEQDTSLDSSVTISPEMTGKNMVKTGSRNAAARK
ncbi:hypothetical protein R1flu_007833 [Riccia fluitans]|uniref:Uncharacterized protein n=1 Tax=Riccia fluitans TaxID=41844 RepID=A0ABD1Z2L9_9MARC